MKIGVYLSRIRVDEGGGATFEEEIIGALLHYAAESNHEFIVFTRSDEERLNGRPENVTVEKIRPTRKEQAQFHATTAVSRVAKAFNAPFQAHYPEAAVVQKRMHESKVEFAFFPTPVSAVTVDAPYLTVVWDLQHRRQPYFPEVGTGGVWERREAHYARHLRRAAVIITGTEAGKAEIEHFYGIPAERIRLLPHPTPSFALESGHTVDPADRVVQQKYGVPDDFIFYPAQFWPHKNHVGLLHAIKYLKDELGRTLPMVFVGSEQGNQEFVRKKARELDLEDQVFFLGFIPQHELPALYRRALALTYLTFFGPENLPPLEAFALGCPVIASKVAGAEEQLGEAALLVDPTNGAEIAHAIKRLSDDPALRETLRSRGFGRAAAFTGEHFVKGIIAILDDFELVRRCWGAA